MMLNLQTRIKVFILEPLIATYQLDVQALILCFPLSLSRSKFGLHKALTSELVDDLECYSVFSFSTM